MQQSTIELLYDDKGNRTKRTHQTTYDSTVYVWDHRNRLVEVRDYDGNGTSSTGDDTLVQEVDYAYDADNQIVKRIVDVDGATGSDPIEQTFYLWENGQILLQLDKTGPGDLTYQDLSHRYLWGPLVDQLLADEQVDWTDSDPDGEVLWALTDHLGTVRDIVNNSATVVDHAEYSAFGKRLDPAAVDVVFGFTGKLFDKASGLQNNHRRWYDAAVGEWASEDFIWDGTNPHAYVGNEPTKYVDPTGLIEEIEIGGGVKIIRHKTGVLGIIRGSSPGYGIEPAAWNAPSDVYIALRNAEHTGNACFATGNSKVMDSLAAFPGLYSWEYDNLEEYNRFYKELVRTGVAWGTGLPSGGRPNLQPKPAPGGGTSNPPVMPEPGPVVPIPAPGRPPSSSPRYWWSGRYSTPASQPGAYAESFGRVFPTRRNSGLTGDALRAAQEAFTKTRLCEGQPFDVVIGQAGEAGLTILRGPNGMRFLADPGANNAITRGHEWFNFRDELYKYPLTIERE